MFGLFDRGDSDRGASLVMLSFSMVLMLGIAAVAVDLAGLRVDRRADRLATDAAVTAGVRAMDPFSGTGAPEACKMAWDYLLLNLEDLPSTPAPADCDTVFATACDPLVAREMSATVDNYSFVITHPVPDDHDLMGNQTIEPLIDGTACQRVGVTATRSRPHTFARVLGFDSGSTTVHSVGRSAAEAGDSEVVPLLVLEPLDCPAVYTSGDGKVTVTYDTASETPGFIVVDSNASTCGNSNPYSIDAKGEKQGWIKALPVPDPPIPSAILSYALAGIGSADPSASYDPSDLPDRLSPEPQAISQRITRAPLDWRYNCKTTYDDYLLDTSNPGLGGIEILPCPKAGLPTTVPYIDTLIGSYGGTGEPAGFQVWSAAEHSCDVSSDITVSGNWYVDCPTFQVRTGATVTFNGSNIVFDGGIDLRSKSGTELIINQGSAGSYFIYLRDGIILKRAQASLVLEETFGYLANGKIDLRAGEGGLTWTAPAGTTFDPISGIDLNFEDLALWSEAMLTHEIGGQSGNDLVGTFFTPYAEPFLLAGQGSQFQLQAQFITRRLQLGGTAEVMMTPDPEKSTGIPIRAVKLIR